MLAITVGLEQPSKSCRSAKARAAAGLLPPSMPTALPRIAMPMAPGHGAPRVAASTSADCNLTAASTPHTTPHSMDANSSRHHRIAHDMTAH
jgi:hypothetical protein